MCNSKRKIYGPIQEKGEKCTIQELYKLYQSLDIVRTVEVAQLRWAVHLQRMGDSETPRSTSDIRMEGRTVRRPKLWWMDGVVGGLRKLGIQRLWTVIRDKQSWNRVLQIAEAHRGL
jgi:hypothetical protein